MDASSQSPKALKFSFGQKPAAASNGPSFSFGANNNSKCSYFLRGVFYSFAHQPTLSSTTLY